MATIELIHKRVGNDIGIALKLLDSGVAIDWTTVDRVYATLFSDQQRVRLGMCKVVGPDEQDPTILRLLYSGKSPQYLGLTRVVVEVTYHGHVSTFDKPVLVFVASTAEEGTNPVTVEISGSLDPEENNLEIQVSDVDTSVLDAAIDAANAAAESAGAFAEAMEGGITGQVLTKKSDADGDYEWRDPQGGGGGSAEWGHITGTLSDQTDLKDALDAKQNTIANLSTIESGAAAGATAVQPGDLATVATSGDYDDLLNKPTIPAAQVQADWNEGDNTKADYIKNKPSIPAAQVNADWDAESGVAQILNKPTIPAAPGTLNTDNSTAQTVSSSEALSGTVKLHKVSKTGSYNDLLNKPTIPSAPGTLDTTATNAQATNASEALSGSVKLHKVSKTGDYGDLLNKPTIPDLTDYTDQELQTAIDTAFANL